MSLARAPFRLALRGFTLVELSVGLVVLAVLAAFAVSTYSDLSSDAKLVALKGTADIITSASHRNHELKAGGSGRSQPISDCSSAAALAQVPVEMKVTEGTIPPAPGVRGDCNINYTTDPLVTPVNFAVTGS